MNVGRSIKILLVKHGKTQTDVARDLGVTRASVNRHCNLERASMKCIEKYADYFDIGVSEFIKLGEE